MLLQKRGNYHDTIITVRIIALFNYSAYCRSVIIKKSLYWVCTF